MASMRKLKNGRYELQFYLSKYERKALRLSTKSERQALTTKTHIENLVSAFRYGAPIDSKTAKWLTELKPDFRKKLAALGLVECMPDEKQVTLGALLEDYFGRRKDVKDSTKTNWRHTKRNLIDFFAADRPIQAITPGDAKDFECWLKTEARENKYGDIDKDEGLSPDTVRKRISNAKQFFNDAVDHHLIATNPFAKLKSTVQGNRKRDFFVTHEYTDRVLKACPDAQWQLIVALCRYGGLRCPSELLRLRWENVDWAKERVTVWAPKTEHHEGREKREIPLFPEIRPYLAAVRKEADADTVYVITQYRDANTNLRTQFKKIIKRAGLSPWPKLFQNLRSSRQTELEDEFPSHVVCAWIGNSKKVARKHYLQVTSDHFDRATGHHQKHHRNAAQRDSARSKISEKSQPVSTKRIEKETKWAGLDSNQRPQRCQRCTLTN